MAPVEWVVLCVLKRIKFKLLLLPVRALVVKSESLKLFSFPGVFIGLPCASAQVFWVAFVDAENLRTYRLMIYSFTTNAPFLFLHSSRKHTFNCSLNIEESFGYLHQFIDWLSECSNSILHSS